MKLASTIAAVAIVAGSAASAQLAFIQQVGDDNVAVNISENTRGNAGGTELLSEIQVISQLGNNLSAANISNGRDNRAYTYQFNYDGVGPNGVGSQTSVIYQNDDDGSADGNTAITVQNNPGGGSTIASQTIQFGDNNTAINWTDNRGTALAGASAPGVQTPGLIVGGVANAPLGGVVTGFGLPTGIAAFDGGVIVAAGALPTNLVTDLGAGAVSPGGNPVFSPPSPLLP